jgi:hypothetical protein
MLRLLMSSTICTVPFKMPSPTVLRSVFGPVPFSDEFSMLLSTV